MKRKMKLFWAASLIGAVALCSPAVATGQDDGFDFNNQRGEVKHYNAVPGQKLDHQGIIINPTPQSVSRPYTGVFNISGGFKVKDKQNAFADNLGFLKQGPGGIDLVIDFGEKVAKKAGVKPVDGAYVLEIGPKKVTITGYNDRGAFYGLQTLRQILASPAIEKEGGLPMMVINDFPSLKYRGVVEGFYGTPWSHQVRMSLIDFYGQNKMNEYLYGPKDDPYHSSPYWRLPYPAGQAKNIKELVEQAKKNRVNFIWAIHPGKDIRWDKADYDSLVNKFNMMYDLGVRSFAIFFDDIEGKGTDSHMQAKLLNDLTNDFVKAKGDVNNLIICPTDYSQMWAGPGENGQLAIYGRELNPDVEVFWTGAVVCSDLTPETMEFINTRIKRPALYWWNFPVTDYVRPILLQGPVYGLDTSLTSNEVAGLISNPMEHGEASKLALYGVADYSWNTPAYNPLDNWERALVEVMPNAHDAYRTFAIHSADTENGYRRDESWETVTFPYNRFTPEQFDALKKEFEKIVKVEGEIQKGSTNPGLLKELQPWLTQFTLLGKRGLSTLDLIKTFHQGNDSLFWAGYVENVMSPEELQAYNEHKIGTMKLQPFYNNAMDGMVKEFYQKVSGQIPTMYQGAGTFSHKTAKDIAPMLDSDTTTYYHSAEGQREGTWFGIDLLTVRPIDQVDILQGRNSVNDGDYFDNMIIEYSADGKNWTPLSNELKKTYEFQWKGEPVEARYVRMRRLDSNRSSWSSVRTFHVNPLTAERVGLNLKAANVDGMLQAFDNNPTTWSNLAGELSFDRIAADNTLILLMDKIIGQVSVTQLDEKGRQIGFTEVKTPYSSVALMPKTTRIVLNGHALLFEAIQR